MTIAENVLQLKQDFDDVYEAGKYKEWSDFWDVFQHYGERTSFQKAFQNASSGWTARTLRPKYDLIFEGDASFAFYAWENRSNTLDLGAHLKNLGRKFDTSKATNLGNLFAYGYSFIGELPTISCESAGAKTQSLFRSVAVNKIEKVIVTEETDFSYWFTLCNNLSEIRFEGIIANNISFQYSPLSGESAWNVIEHLYAVSGSDEDLFTYGERTIIFNDDTWSRAEVVAIAKLAEQGLDFTDMYGDIRTYVTDKGWSVT